MRLGDFIDFISVERERENRRRTYIRAVNILAQDDTLFITRRDVCQRRGGRNRINLRIGESAN